MKKAQCKFQLLSQLVYVSDKHLALRILKHNLIASPRLHLITTGWTISLGNGSMFPYHEFAVSYNSVRLMKAICNALYQNYRFFKKIVVNFILDSTSTLQVAFICAISLQYLNSIKITGFSEFYRFSKKIPVNPTSDSETTAKVTFTLKFLSQSDYFSIFTPNLTLNVRRIFIVQGGWLKDRAQNPRETLSIHFRENLNICKNWIL